MTKKKISSFEKIGYIKKLPKNADINIYESLLVKKKNGQETTLYRPISKKIEFNETNDFSRSWDVFNSRLV